MDQINEYIQGLSSLHQHPGSLEMRVMVGEPRAKSAKRTKQDKGLFNWTAYAFIKQSVLSPKHRRIINRSRFSMTTYHHPEAPRLASHKFAVALESSTFAKLPTKSIIDQTTWRGAAGRAMADAISFALPTVSQLIDEEHVGQLFDNNLTAATGTLLRHQGSSIGEAVMTWRVGARSTKLQKSDSEHFWKAAVDFASIFDNEHGEVEERGEESQRASKGNSEVEAVQ
ncbi:hypothetical protein GG344DRAFT_67633 [Lentinula edodes]|nr:hypothetical protein GG344DRAFT_67633 [Lentinula edodes]